MRALAVAVVVMVSMAALAQKSTAKKPTARAKGSAAAEQHRQASEAEDRQAIEELHQADIAANLAFDVDKMTAYLDDDVVAMPPNAKPLVGKDAYHAYLVEQQKALANVDILGYEETWDEVRMLGDYAVEYGSIKSRIRPANSKDETPLEYSIMRELKKEPTGIWKVYRTIWNDRTETKKPEKYNESK